MVHFNMSYNVDGPESLMMPDTKVLSLFIYLNNNGFICSIAVYLLTYSSNISASPHAP